MFEPTREIEVIVNLEFNNLFESKEFLFNPLMKETFELLMVKHTF
jgi:hypothetical protein